MKKVMLMAAVMGLVGTAGAAGSVNANVQFNATVASLCQVNGTAFAGQSVTLMAAPTIIYDVTSGAVQSASSNFAGYTIRCTKDTPLMVSATPVGMGTPGAFTAPGAVNSAAMNLYRNGDTTDATLAGVYDLTVNKTASSGPTSPDTYDGTATFTAANGQWGTPAGDYAGTLQVTLSYN